MFQIPNFKYIKPHNKKYLKFKALILKKNKITKFFFLSTMSNFIYYNQLEACRKILRKKLGKRSKIIINVYPDSPFSSKPKETRMGRGKGGNFKWTKKIQPGHKLFTISNININMRLSLDILKRVNHKLPLHVTLIKPKYNILYLKTFLNKSKIDYLII